MAFVYMQTMTIKIFYIKYQVFHDIYMKKVHNFFKGIDSPKMYSATQAKALTTLPVYGTTQIKISLLTFDQ